MDVLIRSQTSSLFFVCVTVLSGCLVIGYENQTIVTSDGAIERTTRFTSQSEYELESSYTLPAGGKWDSVEKNTKMIDSSGKAITTQEYSYQVHHRYEPGALIPSDYVRKSGITDRTSHNTIQLWVHNYWFATRYVYEEAFQDVTDKERAIAAAKILINYYAGVFAEKLVNNLPGVITKSEAMAAILRVCGPLISEMESIYRDEAVWRPADIEANELLNQRLTAVIAQYTEESIKNQLAGEFLKLGDFDEKDLRERIDSTLVETQEQSGEEFKLYNEIADKRLDKEERGLLNPWTMKYAELMEEILGVYGFYLSDEYPFEVMLVMPGTIMNHNGTLTEPGVLAWKFSQADFIWEPYYLRANSLLYYPMRIAVACALGLVMILVVLVVRRRGKAVQELVITI